MGLLSKAIKAGVAKKVFDEVSKPHNQRKIKDFVASMTNGRGKGSSGGQGRGY